jgi:pterin-4a-carbinolamine dehydratase
MQVFFGSSSECSELMEKIGAWLQEEEDVDVLLWTDARAFPLGVYTLNRLVDLAKIVDAAVFMFGEDDRVWYRNVEQLQPRDNVLLEYGIFASRLGLERTIVCSINSAKHPSDLAGLTVLNFREKKELEAKGRLRNWIRELKKGLPLRPAHPDGLEPELPLTCAHVTRRLLPAEINAELQSLPGWQVKISVTDDVPPCPRFELCKRFVFATFADAIRFMVSGVEQIDAWDHHPRWENTWKQTIVYLTTYGIGHAISDLDIALAHYLEDLYTTKFKHTVEAAKP